MKKAGKSNKYQKLNNGGFSLIELIISITILVLIMVPLMNSFYQSIKLNVKAEKVQIQSNLTGSIMEGLQFMDMAATLELFKEPVDPDDVRDMLGIPNVGGTKLLRFNGTGYEEVVPSEYNTLDGLDTYYISIHDIKEGGTSYDVLIELDSTANNYRPSTENTKNSYAMPDAINLDNKANGILFSKGISAAALLDDEALTAFISMGEAYAEQLYYQSAEYQNYLLAHADWLNRYEDAQMQPVPPDVGPEPTPNYNPMLSYPEYVNPDMVKAAITKTMMITVDRNKIDYKINYKREWPAGCDLDPNLEYMISTTTYPNNIENVYLFYWASVFRNFRNDEVIIENKAPNPADNPINFYVAKQEGADGHNMVIVNTKSTDNITVYTNLDSTQIQLKIDNFPVVDGFHSGIVKTEQRDRIYKATVTIYEHVSSTNLNDLFQKELYSIESTREE